MRLNTIYSSLILGLTICCTIRSSTSDGTYLVNTLLNDIVSDGVGLFRYQKDFLNKSNWDIYLADRLLPIGELNMLFSGELLQASAYQQVSPHTHMINIDFKQLKISQLSLTPMTITSKTDIKNEILPEIRRSGKLGIFLISQGYSIATEPDKIQMMVLFLWESNVLRVNYILEIKDNEIVIHDRTVS